MNIRNVRSMGEDLTAHILAGIITIGFFTTAFMAMLGFVDLTDPTASSLVGIVMGYVAGSFNPVLSRYFMKDVRIAPPEQVLESTAEPEALSVGPPKPTKHTPKP